MRPNMAEFLKFLELCHTLGTAFKISPTQPWLNPYTFREVACTFPQSGRCIVALLSPVGHFSVDLRQSWSYRSWYCTHPSVGLLKPPQWQTPYIYGYIIKETNNNAKCLCQCLLTREQAEFAGILRVVEAVVQLAVAQVGVPCLNNFFLPYLLAAGNQAWAASMVSGADVSNRYEMQASVVLVLM